MSGQPAKTHVDIEELVGELAEQYAERLRHGEDPAVEDYIRQYPEAAEALRQILPGYTSSGPRTMKRPRCIPRRSGEVLG